MPSNDPPELQAIPDLVSRLIELLDAQRITEIDINDLLSSILNFVFRVKQVKIEEFGISRVVMPITEYVPGVFPSGFEPIKSLKEIIGIVPQMLWVDFVITMKEQSKIKAKGVGELSIYRKDNEIKVEARDMWFIEEVKEIEPEENIEQRTAKLSKFIKEVVITLLAKILAELGSRALTGK